MLKCCFSLLSVQSRQCHNFFTFCKIITECIVSFMAKNKNTKQNFLLKCIKEPVLSYLYLSKGV